VAFLCRNHHLGAAVLEVVDGQFDDPFGILDGMMLVELDVEHIVLLHPGDGMGGDQFGMKAFGHIGQVLENALDIHHHGVAGPGDDRQFLLQEGAAKRNPVSLEDFIGRAADARELNALGALGLGVINHLRVTGRGDDHLGENRLMAVDDDIDMIFLHTPKLASA
jgi:hypothetical protein